ncbi:glycoside hydrolase family 95 protein [Rutstroemia sp. NJR-2017a WRK4]|nr:glycoside hydrolase family 95 protein [Rutstroemia sp. NJR-2017a WRK4]
MASQRSLKIFMLLFPAAEASGFWSSTAASYGNIIKEAYPLGNGRLGGRLFYRTSMPFGSPGADQVNLNIDSLWSGGPFENSSYTGGNPAGDLSHYLPGIREFIFTNGTGNVDGLLGSSNNYGSYAVLGNLSVSIAGITSYKSYNRSLDFDTGIHTTTYTANDNNTYTSTVYCSFPDEVCVYDIQSTGPLPQVTVSFQNQLTNQSFLNTTCGSGYTRLTGVTQLGPPLGMKYDAIARLVGSATASHCNATKSGALTIPPAKNLRHVTLIVGAGTNYDQTKGNAASGYSFRGADPSPNVESTTTKASRMSETTLRKNHIADYSSLTKAFTLNLPDTAKSAGLETSVILDRYHSSGTADPYLESLLFRYGRHLFITSQRSNSLPTNLQGRWTQFLYSAWSADYHANINMQMNLWGVDQTGLGDLQSATWDYMENTWVPRGAETAKLLYNASGWVTHDEMNIFGHTADRMKEEAQWANYPASAAWMMLHVWDHYEYSQDISWLTKQGYPLIKGVAQFWSTQLQEDAYFHDGTLVVNPCNSPEHGPTTFACTHYQQLIYQVFESVLAVADVVKETDTAFINQITSQLKSLDKGLHIGTWGEIKEWKIPDSFGYDFPNDTHRHLSHLIGWYPGHSISSFQSGYTNSTIQSAISTSLLSRGPGAGPDANAGWEKVWRSACWARLNDTAHAYSELRYAIQTNFAGNGLSMYSGLNEPFQIDANFGLVGAVLSMLVVDLPEMGKTGVHTVVLGPAIPGSWGGGSVEGLRIRGGGVVDFGWDGNGIVGKAKIKGRSKPVVLVNKKGVVLARV